MRHAFHPNLGEHRAPTPVVVVVLVLASASCTGPSAPDGAEGAPIVLISIDTLRSDRLPPYGYDGVRTPHIDALAADSVVFERAYSHYPLTLPAHASILTGLLPDVHGVRDNKGFALSGEARTLAERLGAVGYRTAAFVSCMVLRRGTGIEQGFEVFDDDMEREAGTTPRIYPQRDGAASAARARLWLADLDATEKFFLFLHLFEPHTPYEAPEPFASRYADPYDAEIGYVDRVVGGVLDDLRSRGLYDRSIIVLLSDHGEGLGDHVESEHGLLLYREVLQVPLMIKLPGRRDAGRRVDAPAALIDVVPTVLALLAVGAEELPGRPLLGGERSRPDPAVYSETFYPRYQFGWSELRSVIAGNLHYIQAPAPELYDLVRDPRETVNLFGERDLPASLIDAIAAGARGADSVVDISENERERLAALGYVGGFETTRPRETLPDPKDHIREAEHLLSWMRRLGTDPGLEPERRVLDLMAGLGVRNEKVSANIARSMLEAGRADQAREVMAAWESSDTISSQVLLGLIDAALGRLHDARARFERALAVEPDHAEASMGLGLLLLQESRFREALPRLDRAVELDPGLAEAWSALGVARARTGDVSGAIRAWSRAVVANPRLAQAWFNLAVAHRQTGNASAAVDALERYVPLVDGAEREQAEGMLRELRKQT